MRSRDVSRREKALYHFYKLRGRLLWRGEHWHVTKVRLKLL
jgi:hypothetical protein